MADTPEMSRNEIRKDARVEQADGAKKLEAERSQRQQGAALLEGEGERGEQDAETRAREIFRANPVLIIEDQSHWITGLKKGLEENEKSDAMIAETGSEAIVHLNTMLGSAKGGERFLVISDLQIPENEDEIADEYAGLKTLKSIQDGIAAWNSEHSDRPPIKLEIMMNSSMTQSEEQYRDFKEKNTKYFPEPDALIGSNSKQKNEGVDAMLAYLKRQQETGA